MRRAEKHVESIIEVIVKIRDIRRQMNVEPARRIQANLATNDPALKSVLADARPLRSKPGALRAGEYSSCHWSRTITLRAP